MVHEAETSGNGSPRNLECTRGRDIQALSPRNMECTRNGMYTNRDRTTDNDHADARIKKEIDPRENI